ncbi:MAG: hypothetical protein GXP56_08240 [Deltaproteobacteria bacterium]|nr:hypothetical protein [Deltaproteobacteria bacterium]
MYDKGNIIKKTCKNTMFEFFKNFNKEKPLILPFERQVKLWQKASRKMGWGIKKIEFDKIIGPAGLSAKDETDGFIGSILCYGFGDDGSTHSDAVLSGKLAWDYVIQKWDVKVWQCQYIDFDKPDNIRLWPKAPKRPKGFYTVKFKPGNHKTDKTSARFRKMPGNSTGPGPEGIQLLTITHPHFADLMNQRQMPFMTFSDYDVAPHGFYDFYDAVQMFCSQDTLGLGIGNIDRNYPLFAISEIRF